MPIRHVTIKAAGQKVFAVADWNADHTFLQTDIDHNQITNTHNLTNDIDHNALTNYAANRHFLEGEIDHANILNIGTNTHAEIDTHISNYPPVGSIIMFGGAVAPTGYLLCNNAAVARVGIYAALFAVIGTTFGVGDGATTFNLPDMRGIFPRGAGTSAKLSNANGVAFAGVLGTYQNDKMQGHWHVVKKKTTAELPKSILNATAGGVAGSTWGAETNDSHIAKETRSNGVNGVPRYGNETNPANLGLTFIIKY